MPRAIWNNHIIAQAPLQRFIAWKKYLLPACRGEARIPPTKRRTYRLSIKGRSELLQRRG